jgi:DNA-binding HxlR family transcriptional regulator
MSELRSDSMQYADARDGGDGGTSAGLQGGTRGNLFSEHCPSRQVLKHVTSRWGILLLVALGDGAQRFGTLRRRVGGISERMLAQTLQWLEQDGFVERLELSVLPPHVEYRLTPLGEELGRKLGGIVDWIERNMDGIGEAQRQVAAQARPSA